MAYDAITYANKVENNGTTPAGRFGADDLNEIKTVTNANGSSFDVRIDALEAGGGGGGVGTPVSSSFVGDGATVAFVLTFTPTSGLSTAFVVGIDGVLQSPVDAYTVSTNTSEITFSSAPPVGSDIVVTTSSIVATDLSESTVVATGSTEDRKLTDRFADTVNVKDFGAVGDGVTDDTAAIQAALDTSVGKVVYFNGSKTFAVSQLTFKANSTIILNGCEFNTFGGVSEASPCLVFTSNNITVVGHLKLNVTGTISQRGIVFLGENLTTDQITVSYNTEFAPADINNSYAIRLASVLNSSFGAISALNSTRGLLIKVLDDTDLVLGEFTGYTNAINIRDYSNVRLTGGYIHSPSLTADVIPGNNGILMGGDTKTPRNLLIDGILIEDSGEHGIRHGGSFDYFDVSITNSTIRRSGGSNIKFLSGDNGIYGHNIKVMNCNLEDALQSGIKLSCGIIAYRLKDSIISNVNIKAVTNPTSGEHGISLHDVLGLQISNTFIQDALENGISTRPTHSGDGGIPQDKDINDVMLTGGQIKNCGGSGIHIDYTGIDVKDFSIDTFVSGSGDYSVEFADSLSTGTVSGGMYFNIRSIGATTADFGGTGYSANKFNVQLADVIYSGFVGSDAVANNNLPDGFSVTLAGTGIYDITHNLGIGKLLIVPTVTPYDTITSGNVVAGSTTNICRFSFRSLVTAAYTDTAFYFEIRIPNRNRP